MRNEEGDSEQRAWKEREWGDQGRIKKEWRDKNIKVNEQERNDGGGVKKFETWLKFMASFI